MNRVTHFEIPADDVQRASEFYREVFGWKFNSWGGPEEYLLIETGAPDVAGINGGLMKRKHPNQPVVNSIDVLDIDASMKMIEHSGGTIVVPKTAIPGVGWLAYFKDTEQNIFGIMQPDATAK